MLLIKQSYFAFIFLPLQSKNIFMLNKKLLITFSLIFIFSLNALAVKWQSVGTGEKYTLSDLVANSGGTVTFNGSNYLINDTIEIKKTDTLSIEINTQILFAPNTYLWINGGVIYVNPSTSVKFTAQDTLVGFLGIRFDSSNHSYLKNVVFEFAVSFKLSDSSPTFENCVFQKNNIGTSTSFGNGAISLFRANPLIKNCSFLNNRRAAIQGGANISNAPKIYNSLFEGNNTMNQNVPQINLGATSTGGTDTVKIIDCNIINAGGIQCGGIGFLAIGEVYAVITGNTITNNRYGITLNGGNNIHSLINYNNISNNNIQNNPALGGSGIAFSGGSASSVGQFSIVARNIISNNLWGITIQNRSKPNIGNLNNVDTLDNGNNHFINNTNTSTPGIDLYNNTVDSIDAQNNYWNTDEANIIESKVFHYVDNASLGFVNFVPFLTSANLPVILKNFDAVLKRNDVLLTWQTSSEINTSHFNIQKSYNGTEFTTIGTLLAKGNSNQLVNYYYTDKINTANNKHFYRLEMVDKDGTKTYSKTRLINNSLKASIQLYPNPATDYVIVVSTNAKKIQVLDISGKAVINIDVTNNHNIVNLKSLTAGNYILAVTNNDGEVVTEKLIKK